MKSGRAIRRFALAVAAIFGALVAGVVFAQALQTGAEGRPALDKISNTGRPVDLADVPARERVALEPNGIVEIRLLGERAGKKLYLGSTAEGKICPIIGRADTPAPQFGFVGCLAPGTFPSPEMPIVEFAPRMIPLTALQPDAERSYFDVAMGTGLASTSARSPSEG